VGDPDGVKHIAVLLDETAAQIEDIRTLTASTTLNGIWEGAAAEAFHHILQGLPDDLHRASTSYGDAAGAMHSYAASFRTAYATARVLAGELEKAQAHAATTASALTSATDAHSAASKAHAQAGDPATAASTRTALTAAAKTLSTTQQAHSEASTALTAIKTRAHANRGTLDKAASLAHHLLAHASGETKHNSIGSAIGRHGGDWAYDHLIKPAVDLPFALGHLLDDAVHGKASWDDVRRVLTDVSAVLTLAVVILAVVVAPFTGGASLEAVMGAIILLKEIQIGVDAAKTEVDLVRANEGDKGANVDLVNDSLGLGLDFVGLKLGGGSLADLSEQKVVLNTGAVARQSVGDVAESKVLRLGPQGGKSVLSRRSIGLDLGKDQLRENTTEWWREGVDTNQNADEWSKQWAKMSSMSCTPSVSVRTQVSVPRLAARGVPVPQ
jgi:hypothetical protein